MIVPGSEGLLPYERCKPEYGDNDSTARASSVGLRSDFAGYLEAGGGD